MFMSEKDFTKNFNILELENSTIVVAERKIILPEKQIILLNNEFAFTGDKEDTPAASHIEIATMHDLNNYSMLKGR